MTDLTVDTITGDEDAVVQDSQLSFADLGLTGGLLEGVEAAGFTSPSEIQTQAIPTVLAGKDLIGQAQTGSGKTGAFALPAMEQLKMNGTVEILVLVPTRELASQVVVEFKRLGKFKKVKAVTVVGGENGYHQIKDINRGANVVVATPGRMLDHLKSGRLGEFAPKMLILDEADEMLDMGFIEDIRTIISFLPEERQTMLFSATMPAPIAKLAKTTMTNPEHIKLNGGKASHQDIEQVLYCMRDRDRMEALTRILETEDPDKAIVFCRTKRDVDDLTQRLVRRGVNAKALHGDLRMEARTYAMNEFKRGHVKVLIATDVASRGLDVDNISHVFNYHLPENKDRYTHRIGRTGRAGNKGVAITFATILEMRTGYFFRLNPPSQFNLKSVPTARDVQDKNTTKQLEKVSTTEVSEHAIEIANALADNYDPFDLLCHFVAHMQSSTDVSGPDKIGLSPEEVKASFTERSGGGGRSGGRDRKGGGYRGGRPGGGYRGRSGGSRDQSDSRDGGYKGSNGSGGRPKRYGKDENRSSGGRPKGGRKAGAGSSSGGARAGGAGKFTKKKRA